MSPGIMSSPTSAKNDLCNTSNAKCLVFQSQTSRCRPKNHPKENLETSMNKYTFFGPRYPKSFQNAVFKSIKNQENRSLDLKVSFVGLPNVRRSSKGPQGRQSEASNMPNDRFAYQKNQGHESTILERRAMVGGRRQRA